MVMTTHGSVLKGRALTVSGLRSHEKWRPVRIDGCATRPRAGSLHANHHCRLSGTQEVAIILLIVDGFASVLDLHQAVRACEQPSGTYHTNGARSVQRSSSMSLVNRGNCAHLQTRARGSRCVARSTPLNCQGGRDRRVRQGRRLRHW